MKINRLYSLIDYYQCSVKFKKKKKRKFKYDSVEISEEAMKLFHLTKENK